jgi:TolB-like protein/DNA-binding winged helix-turn-helix (wHTH) protein/Flp pilus assembly protein TadD
MSSLTSTLYAFGEFSMDPQNRVLRLREDPVALTPKAFEVLLLLIQRNGQLVSKSELMQAVWPDSFVEESNLTQTIFMLRKALGETSNQRYIQTVQGRGYRFAAEVRTVAGNGHLIPREFPPFSARPGQANAAQAAPGTIHEHSNATDARGIQTLPAQPPVESQNREHWKKGRAVLTFGALILAAIASISWLVTSLSHSANSRLPLRSIAVLPLDNFSGDPSQEYFVDGMTDELTTDLAKLSSLHVISRTSVMRYKGTKKSLPEIARELNVDGIVEGSVVRSGQRVRITAQLIQAATDRHLWAETYERDLVDVLRLQSEVAETIARQVDAQLTSQQQVRLHSARTVNPEAYEAYLRGRYYLTNQYTTAQPLNKAKGYFEESIRKDPSFALAYARLADAYVYLAIFRQMSRDSAYVSAKEALRKAVELDDSIGEVHDTLGVLSWRFDWNWDAAEQEFDRAIKLAPSYSCAHEDRANFLGFLGKRGGALAGMRRSNTIDPGPASAMTEVATYYQLRDFPALVEAGQKAVASNPNEWTQHLNLGIGYQGTGKLLEAISEYQKAIEISNGDQDATAYLAHAYATIGRTAEARKILLDLEQQSKSGYVSPYMIAAIYAGLGDRDKSFEFMEKAFQEKSLDASWHLKADIRIDNLRSDPRFQSMLRRVRLPS